MQRIVFQWGKHIAAIVLFLLLSIAFFSPAVIDGKTLRQDDNEKAHGMGHSQMEPYEKTAEPGEFSVWSDAMFGGMPYASGYGDAAPKLPGFKWLEKPFKSIEYTTASMVFIGLICFYILMCIMGVSWWLAVAGAIAFAFASYNIIIIAAGHIVKAYVIGYMPLALAGMALLFKRKYIWGGLLFLLGITFSISNGHIQITYYLFLLCLFLYIGYAWMQFKKKELGELGKVTGIMALCVILAILPNAVKLYSDWDLGQHSIRGATELTTVSSEGEKISSGLDKDCAFQWSYGKKELLTLLIPNAYGSASGTSLGRDSESYKAAAAKGAQLGKEIQLPLYWGDKPGTSGPVYFGAIICYLFILGMFVIKNPVKWWLFGGAVFLTLLAFGRNLDWFNDIMFHYLPMYNKFRTVEMALVIPGLVCPIIAIWGLQLILSEKSDEPTLRKGMLWSTGITGALCLLVWLVPDTLLSFQSNYDAYYGLPDWLLAPLRTDRMQAASSDALRSLFFILASAGLLFWFSKAQNKEKTATIISIVITVLILVDLWTVDRRYVNDSNYINQKASQVYKPSVADKEILQDQSSYRVLNLNNPFQETSTSYFHHSIGGYHAAKLRRYQELIDNRLSKETGGIISALQNAQTALDLYEAFAQSPSLNMLNTKYIIYNPEQPPLTNPYAYGNAWFVENVHLVENADEEIAALNQLDPFVEAVVDKRFAGDLQGFIPQPDTTATIELISYRPNKLIYTSESTTEQLAIFSEIYYQPGWRAFIDGQPISHIRANWILRAMRIPAGKHEITFEFYPESYVKASYISSYSSLFILLIVLVGIGYSIRKEIIRGRKI
ncbi:MAG: YfhO family protein [Tannerellaceae bacterium]|nr:YfhO family protein [Tannerellaceae bacterium]